jgi:NAD(P)-dependent dehydrogenase (short-subunit alcohol dehydrogenase family)
MADARPRDGRVVLITGAHGGLGNAATLACVRAGATVVLLGHKVPKLNRLYDRVAAEGGTAMLYPLDLEGASPDDTPISPRASGRSSAICTASCTVPPCSAA